MKACQAHQISHNRRVRLAREGGLGRGEGQSTFGEPLRSWCISLNGKVNQVRHDKGWHNLRMGGLRQRKHTCQR